MAILHEKRVIFWAAASAASLYLGCGPNMAFLTERSQSEAQILQESCRKAGLQGHEITAGDALLTASAKLTKDGEAAPARLASEEAAGQYRLALARADKEKSEKEAAATEGALAKDKDRLGTYREILDEMKTMRKP